MAATPTRAAIVRLPAATRRPAGQPALRRRLRPTTAAPPAAPPRQEDYGRRRSPGPAYPDQGGYPPSRAAATRIRATAASRTAARTYGPSPTTAATASPRRQAVTPTRDTAEPAGGGYDYGPPAGAPAGGYGGYGQGDYPAGGATITLQLDDGSGRTYQLREGANVIGRGQDAQFRLPDTGVSRRHLEIRWDGQVALLADLNSTNGTTVNNAPVQEWQLADGDVIRLGHSEIIVRVH